MINAVEDVKGGSACTGCSPLTHPRRTCECTLSRIEKTNAWEKCRYRVSSLKNAACTGLVQTSKYEAPDELVSHSSAGGRVKDHLHVLHAICFHHMVASIALYLRGRGGGEEGKRKGRGLTDKISEMLEFF